MWPRGGPMRVVRRTAVSRPSSSSPTLCQRVPVGVPGLLAVGWCTRGCRLPVGMVNVVESIMWGKGGKERKRP